MLERLYESWKADVAVGKSTLTVAPDTATVAELNGWDKSWVRGLLPGSGGVSAGSRRRVGLVPESRINSTKLGYLVSKATQRGNTHGGLVVLRRVLAGRNEPRSAARANRQGE